MAQTDFCSRCPPVCDIVRYGIRVSHSDRYRVSIALVASAIVSALVLTAAGAAALYWSRPVAAPPETSAAAPAAPVASMTTWLEVEPVRAGVRQDTYESVGGDTLADGWRLRVHVSPRAAGQLTVLSDATPARSWCGMSVIPPA